MTIEFSCPVCKQNYKAPDDVAGRQTWCRKCGTVLAPTPLPPSPPAPTPLDQPPPFDWPPSATDAPVAPAERFRMRPSRSKKGALLLVFLCLVGLGVLGAAGYSVWTILRGSGLGDELKYLPDESQTILSLKVEQLQASAAWKELTREIPTLARVFDTMPGPTVLPADKVAAVTLGGKFTDNKPVVVVRTKTAMTAADIKSAIGQQPMDYRETKVGRYTLYEGSATFCPVDSKLIVFADAITLRKILERDGKPKLSEAMQAAVKQADFTKSLALAVSIKDIEFPKPPPPPLPKPWGGKEDFPKGPGFGPRPGPFGLEFLANVEKMIKEVEGIALTVHAGSDVELNLTLLCRDSKAADEWRRLVDGLLVLFKKVLVLFAPNDSMAQELSELFEAFACSSSGSKVTVKGKARTASILRIFQEAQKGTFRLPGL
jgi:hypothetical protein